jgi:hypothetical protein
MDVRTVMVGRFSGAATGYSGEVAESAEHERLAQLNDEIRTLVARHPERSAAQLLEDVEAVLSRYHLPEPSREGLLQWIDQAIAETRAR